MSGQTKFLHIADIHAPYITRKVRSEYAPWLTDTIKRDMYHRDVLNKKAIKTAWVKICASSIQKSEK